MPGLRKVGPRRVTGPPLLLEQPLDPGPQTTTQASPQPGFLARVFKRKGGPPLLLEQYFEYTPPPVPQTLPQSLLGGIRKRGQPGPPVLLVQYFEFPQQPVPQVMPQILIAGMRRGRRPGPPILLVQRFEPAHWNALVAGTSFGVTSTGTAALKRNRRLTASVSHGVTTGYGANLLTQDSLYPLRHLRIYRPVPRTYRS